VTRSSSTTKRTSLRQTPSPEECLREFEPVREKAAKHKLLAASSLTRPAVERIFNISEGSDGPEDSKWWDVQNDI
jgi:hypothetical protein